MAHRQTMQSRIARYLEFSILSSTYASITVIASMYPYPVPTSTYGPTASPFLIPITNTMVNMPEDVHKCCIALRTKLNMQLMRICPPARWMLCPKSYNATPSDICFLIVTVHYSQEEVTSQTDYIDMTVIYLSHLSLSSISLIYLSRLSLSSISLVYSHFDSPQS